MAQDSCDSHIDTKREISQMNARVLCKNVYGIILLLVLFILI